MTPVFLFYTDLYILLVMNSNEIRQRFLDFFSARGHAVLPSAPLIPESDGEDRNITLFNVAGMQPLMPYLLGEDHPQGTRLASSQKCLRTVDIDEVGDNTHATFFEMLGNWSLGDYFKEDAIKWSYEFLTDKEEGLGLDPARLYVTVFAGNESVERDDEAAVIWKKYVPESRIYYRDGKDNWWTAGADSPAGPSSEMFYDLTINGIGNLTADEFEVADERQDVVEIWNNVFMSYKQEDGKVVGELPKKNIDTGAGLERLTAVMQNKQSIFDTDLFSKVLQYLKESVVISKDNDGTFKSNGLDLRIIADHMRATLFLISEDLTPSNTGRGYILRRLIRISMSKALSNGLKIGHLLNVVQICKQQYIDIYDQLLSNSQYEALKKELHSFEKTLDKGMKEFEKGERDAFTLFTTFGFPLEMTQELAVEKGEEIDINLFEQKMKEHQEKSRGSSAGQFKGGLSDTNDPAVLKLHTAHHLLLAALQQVLGSDVKQRGSNITPERLRIDFVFDRKMTPEEKEEVENIVNEKITEALPVVKKKWYVKTPKL